MKNTKRRNQDIKHLSAYLDDVLSDKQRQVIEARLEHETELKEKLEKLRKTKIVLGSLTRLEAPRNFTLTPDMVDVKREKRQPLFTSLRLATALAAILLVVLFGAEFLFIRGPLATPRMAAEHMMEAAQVVDEATPEPLITWGEPDRGEGFEEGLGTGMEFREEPAVEIESLEIDPEIQEEIVEELLPEDYPEDFLEEDVDLPPVVDMEAMVAEAEEVADDPILGLRPDVGEKITAFEEPVIMIEEPARTWPDAIRWAQIGLAAIVLGGGLGLWLLKIKFRN